MDEIALLNALDDCRQVWIKGAVSTFSGVPVRLDRELSGMNYYVSVSQELFDALEKDRYELTGS